MLLKKYFYWIDFFIITCKISRLIDLRYGMKNKISLLMLQNIWALVEFHYLTVPFRIFWVFSRKFRKTPKKTETVWYLYFTEVRQFQSIGRISLPYRTISDFLRLKRNSSMDGRNFAGAYFFMSTEQCKGASRGISPPPGHQTLERVAHITKSTLKNRAKTTDLLPCIELKALKPNERYFACTIQPTKWTCVPPVMTKLPHF